MPDTPSGRMTDRDCALIANAVAFWIDDRLRAATYEPVAEQAKASIVSGVRSIVGAVLRDFSAGFPV